ncbi:MFS transporter [Pyxidicoccus parkwayensis]|uniref:MFS transporter n=1 Tax=Pyxidicoccus parkwayensis TaxID=2813578 RepID=A0ABX7NUT6_9BACT|nr:MFS transporter [Pyxidicoccus parkwaysis]QSQ19883.1 MFS transporter [Pyxidicoccus parkwaysis]
MTARRLSSLPSFRAFGHRDFVAVWCGALVSNIGTWMEVLALGVYVTAVTGKAGWTGGIAALTYLPSVALSPLGGALADRFDRRLFIAACNLAQVVLAVTLTALAFTDHLSVPAVAVISFLNGCVHVLVMPAYTALITGLVPQEDLHSAMSLTSMQFNLGRIVGPMLAAPLLAVGGVGWVFLLNAVSFLAVLAAVLSVRPQRRPASAPPSRGLWADIAEGARVSRRDPAIWLALVGTFTLALFVSPFIGLVPVFALKVFGLGAAAASGIVSMQGVGALVASVLVGSLVERWGRQRLLDVSLLLMGPVAAAFWLSPTLPVAMGTMLVLGAVYMVALTGLGTRCQERAPRELAARVSSFAAVLLNVGYSLGVWLQGALMDHVGVRPVTATAAVLFLGVAVVLRAQRPREVGVPET